MSLFLKRALDAALAALLLVLLAPLLAIVACLVRRKLGTPVLFRQARIGLHGRIFTLIKFRSMTSERDAAGNLLPDAVRLTSFGRFLRASSLDELPELWNILIGNMSFVGPRPLLPEYMPYYTQAEHTRHTMRPGITGLAQAMGRNALSWDTRLAYDVEYVERFSLGLDLWILWRTFWLVVKGTGVSAEGHVTMRRLDDERKGTV